MLGLLILGYALLALAWAVGNPPGAAPDEGDHYLRALAVASGDLRGRPNPELAGQPQSLPKAAGEAKLAALWLKKGTRIVTVPAGLAPVEWGCNAFKPNQDASCVLGQTSPAGPSDRPTTMGTVEPAMYLLPGLAARVGDRPETALRLGRLADAAVAVALIGVAAFLLWAPSGSPVVLAGLLVAITPMVIFLASSVSLSGPEAAAGICFFAALLRVGRGDGGKGVWVATGVAGVVLASSRSLGPVWILLMAAVVVGWRGRRAGWAAARDGGAAAAVAVAAIAIAAGSTAVWEAAFQPGVDIDGAYFLNQLGPSFGELPGVGRDLVGHFGWLDTRMPALAYLTWAAMALVLLALALRVGTRRQRVLLCAVLLGTVVVTVLISAGLLRQNGFRVQGRHVLAFAVMAPLLAGDVLAGGAGRPGRTYRRWFALGFAGPALAVHAVGWYANARRSAVGADGPVWFVGLSRWSPPGTWALWSVLVALGVMAGVGAAWVASSEQVAGGVAHDLSPH